MDAAFARHWGFRPGITFLNHGSYGACPTPVLQAQQRMRQHLEEDPVHFFIRELEPRLDEARAAASAFVGCRAEDFAFVPNATFGVNTVLRSLGLASGDELLTTRHAYNACRNALEAVAQLHGARVVVAEVPLAAFGAGNVAEAILSQVTARTRLLLVDHIASPTGAIFPVEALARTLEARGVAVLVDGAHAPGMVPLEVRSLGASYYTGNFHKWVCAPKGAAFLYVREDRQKDMLPLSVSHGANSPREDRSRFRLQFDWAGTDDPTPYLCVPEALRFMASLLPGGWPAIYEENHRKVLAGRDVLVKRNGLASPLPEDCMGSLAILALPALPGESAFGSDPLQKALWEEHRIEVPVFSWPGTPRRLLRLSAQLYNSLEDYERLAGALSQGFDGP
jgi:isopenicillin-N epimerase